VLAGSNATFPWVKLELGVGPTILICVTAGLLAARLDRSLVSALIWAVAGYALGWLAGCLPYQGMSAYVARSDPAFGAVVHFAFSSGPQTRGYLAVLLNAGLLLLGGLLFGELSMRSATGGYLFARLMPLVLWMVVFAVAGSVTDWIVNDPLRGPVQAVDGLIRSAQEYEETSPGSDLPMAYHLSVLRPVQDLLYRARKLTVTEYDAPMVMVKVMVDFDGTLARCTVMEGVPLFCERLP
jgi:hypothetical protein